MLAEYTLSHVKVATVGEATVKVVDMTVLIWVLGIDDTGVHKLVAQLLVVVGSFTELPSFLGRQCVQPLHGHNPYESQFYYPYNTCHHLCSTQFDQFDQGGKVSSIRSS